MSDVQQEKTGLDPGLEEELKQRAAQQLAQSVTPGGTAAAEKTGTPPASAPTPAAAQKQPQGVTLNEQSAPIDPNTGRPVTASSGFVASGIAGAKNPVAANVGVPNVQATLQNATLPPQPANQTVAPVIPPKANVVQSVSPAMEAQKVSPVVAAGQQMALAEPATPDAQKDPIKTATQQPGFWDQLLSASKTAGRNIFELIGDFASGYSHQQSSPTQQRLDREQQLRLQGNSQQAAKDLQSMEEGFQGKQQQADRDLQDKIATASQGLTGQDLALKRQQLQQEHDQFIQNLSLEKMRVQNEYMINMFNAQWQRQAFGMTHPVAAPEQLWGGTNSPVGRK